MDGTPAIYLGRIIEKENFRAFIYAPCGGVRLVESWDEFEATMQSGVWFATKEDAIASVPQELEKPKARSARSKKDTSFVTLEPKEDAIIEDDDMAFEVKDDFLPT